MRKSRFSVEQIVAALKQAELGMPVADLSGTLGSPRDVLSVEEAIRRAAIGPGAGVEATARGERAPEEDGRRAQPGQGDPAGRRSKKVVGPALKGQVAHYVLQSYQVSQRRACRLVRQHRGILFYPSRKDPRIGLRSRMREIAQTRVRYGYRRIHVLLRREGWTSGKNLIHRLYCEEQLQLRSKRPRRRKMSVARRERPRARQPNDVWAMDFVADQLVNGKRFRALTIVDVFSREALVIPVGQRLGADDVVNAFNRLVAQR